MREKAPVGKRRRFYFGRLLRDRRPDQERPQFRELVALEAPDIAVGIADVVALVVLRRDVAECGEPVTFTDEVVDLEVRRLLVGFRHPLPDHALTAQGAVA